MSVPSHPLGRLAHGAALLPRAAACLASRRGLWGYALLPILLTALGLALGLYAFWPVSEKLLSLAWAEPAGALAVLWMAARIALYLLLVFAAAVALPSAVAAPACDRLSASVEALELPGEAPGSGPARLALEAGVALWHGLARLFILLMGHALLLLILAVPGLGVAYPAAAFLWSAAWLGFEQLDVAMSRHLRGFREVRAALRAVRPLSLGLGAPLALLLVVPFANLLVLPLGAVAGTLLYCDLVRDGIVRPSVPGGSQAGPEARLPRR
jgi:CysZ protein